MTNKIMKQYKTIFITFLVVIASLHSWAQDSIDSLINSYMSEHKIPGLALGVTQNDSIIKLGAYGVSSMQSRSEVRRNTSFELGSLSKQFTASAIIKLHQNKKLELEDYLHQYFPECPKHWRDIKIKHLLWHTSGLPGMFTHDNYTQSSFTGYVKMDANKLDGMMQTNLVTKKLSIESIITDSLDFTPGTDYNYSDVGYLVLGIVIDNITGSYKSYLENEIFRPLNMQHTYVLNQEKVVTNQARGYSLKNGEIINIMRTWDYEIPSFFGVFSNVEDMLNWNYALENNKILNEKSKTLLFSKGKLDDDSEVEYGGGWEINDINNLRFISHNGVTGTRMVKVPHSKFCLILLTNLGYNGNDFVDPWSLVNKILACYKIETKINENHITSNGQKTIPIKKRCLKNLEGLYSTNDGIKAIVKIENGIPIFENQGSKNKLALLEKYSWLVLGMEYEYILSFDEKKGVLTSNYGRKFIKQQ